MRSLTIDECTAAIGGDGNETACETAVGAATGLAAATGGPVAGGAAAAVAPTAIAVCEVATTAAGQAIASGVASAGEGIDNFSDALTQGLGAFQMTMIRGGVHWLSVDGL